MEDIENSGVIAVGSGVIVTTDSNKVIGFLQGTDELYLYIKVTHRWGTKEVKVTEESSENLRKILGKRPLWMLKAQVAWKYKAVTLGMDREELVEILADSMEQEALEELGPMETFLPEAKAVNMGIPHMTIQSFESLQDVVAGTVLADLDFSILNDYDEEYEEEEDEDADDTDPTD